LHFVHVIAIVVAELAELEREVDTAAKEARRALTRLRRMTSPRGMRNAMFSAAVSRPARLVSAVVCLNSRELKYEF
jgi:hypothetical protein